MPVVRVVKENAVPLSSKFLSKSKQPLATAALFPVGDVPEDLAICDVKYPLNSAERATYKTKTGKKVTSHQWAVYDFIRKIPCGKVITYKDVATALGKGSPRSVGGALRNNPFAPFVPCHRVVASNLFIGGFYGEWGLGVDDNDENNAGCEPQGMRKMRMLGKEGVQFTKDGYLLDKSAIWRG